MTGLVRLQVPSAGGYLTAAAGSADSALYSGEFSSLPTGLTPDRYVPVTLYHPAIGFETTWGVGHDSSTPNKLTVLRSREGSVAPPDGWPPDTAWSCAITPWDAIPEFTRATLPNDGFIGMRARVRDEGGFVLCRTSGGKWVPDSGLAEPGDIGPGVVVNAQGVGIPTVPPDGSALAIRGGTSGEGATDANGYREISYRQPFNIMTLAVVPGIALAGAAGSQIMLWERRADRFKVRVYTTGPTPQPRPNFVVAFDYIALGVD